MSTALQPVTDSISQLQSSHNSILRRRNPQSKAQTQSSQQPPSVDGEKKTRKRRRRRYRSALVSAAPGSSTPAAASTDIVSVVSGPRANLPAAGKTKVGKRPQTLPRAPATAPSLRQPESSRQNLVIPPLIRQSKNKTEPIISLTPEEKAARKQEQKQQRHLKKKEDHLNLVFSAANATITTLNRHGLSCAAFGSLACKLYGTFRDPKDVDVLILQPPDIPPRTAEQVKALIVDTDPQHFYLKLPRDPAAPYRILYYRSDSPRSYCKVDILLPGTMYLPDFSPPSSRKHINTISGIPLVPFSLLLLHKLQGWSDHINAPEEHKRRRHVQDAADVRRLLAMEARMNDLRRARPWSDTELFCEEFQQLTKERVKKYCETFPNRAAAWQLLGFETSSDLAIYHVNVG